MTNGKLKTEQRDNGQSGRTPSAAARGSVAPRGNDAARVVLEVMVGLNVEREPLRLLEGILPMVRPSVVNVPIAEVRTPLVSRGPSGIGGGYQTEFVGTEPVLDIIG